MKRERVVSLRVTEEEYRMLTESAKHNKKSVSEFARDKILATPVEINWFNVPTTTSTVSSSSTVWHNIGGHANA